MSESLADVTIMDLSGTSVALASLWAHRPAVITFLRHYG